MNGQWTPEMELGGSPVSSSGNNNSDSLNGLKFGKKIYFENVGAGSSSVAGAKSLPPVPVTTKRGRGGLVQGGATPRCQVEGCEADLSDVKAYYLRHKVCGMHSKSPTVIVAGLEQRFCQQCSRFHQLPEFDQGKRSCRRRLACHNERRRKPPSGSLLSTHFGSLSSSIFENNSRSGSFLVDFSAPPNLNESAWPNTRATEQGWDPQNTAPGKFLQRPWINNNNSHQSATAELVLQGSGNCSLGASDSSGALSLLSNRSYGSRNRPSVHGVNSVINIDDAAHIVPNHFSSPSLGYNKGNEGSSSSHEMPLRQISQADNNQYSGELGMAQHSGQQYMELEHSKGYHPSVQNVHWTL